MSILYYTGFSLNFVGLHLVIHIFHTLRDADVPPEGHNSFQSCLGRAEHPSLCGLGQIEQLKPGISAILFPISSMGMLPSPKLT